MNKSVLIAIQPYWVFLIIARAMGWDIPQHKTVEARKDFPKDPAWNKVTHIYCSKNRKSFKRIPKQHQPLMEKFLGKVVGEFVCNKVKEFTPCAVRLCGLDYNICVSDFFATCLTDKELNEYGKDKPLYGWHITDLKIYDKPKELGEFTVMRKCTSCKDSGYESGACAYDENCMIPVPIEKAPQSWQFVYKE